MKAFGFWHNWMLSRGAPWTKIPIELPWLILLVVYGLIVWFQFAPSSGLVWFSISLWLAVSILMDNKLWIPYRHEISSKTKKQRKYYTGRK